MNDQGLYTREFSLNNTVKEVLRYFLAIKLHKTEVSEEDIEKVALVKKKEKQLAFSLDSRLATCGFKNSDIIKSTVQTVFFISSSAY